MRFYEKNADWQQWIHNSVSGFVVLTSSPLFSSLYPLYFNCNFMQISLLSCRGEKVGNQIGSNVIQFTKQGMNR